MARTKQTIPDLSDSPPSSPAASPAKKDDGWIISAPSEAAAKEAEAPAAAAPSEPTPSSPAPVAAPAANLDEDGKKADRALSSLASRIGGLSTDAPEEAKEVDAPAEAAADGEFRSLPSCAGRFACRRGPT
jgi:hypothetical protein